MPSPATKNSPPQVAGLLAEETNAPRRPLPGHPQYTFELVRREAPSSGGCAPPAGGRDPGSAAYTTSVVESARKVFAASFAPLIMEDGRDMLELVCNSYFDAEGQEPYDFSASLLRRNDAASMRRS
jgi:hypothetical protein